MDLGNIPAGELHQGCCALAGSVGRNQYLDSRRLGFGQGSREIRNLVAGRLVPVWIRNMAIGYENRQLAEVGLDTDSPIRVTWPSDLNTGSVRIIRDDIPMTERQESCLRRQPRDRRTHTHGFPEWFEEPYRTARWCANRAACSRRRATG